MPQNTDPNNASGASGGVLFDFNVKVKRIHPAAKLPARGTRWSAGADLCCLEDFTLGPRERKSVPTGLIIEMPPGWYGRVAPRSGLADRHGVDILAGVIDPDFRGELKALIVNTGESPVSFDAGERIAQLIIERAAVCNYLWADELSETERCDDGFGSTGK
ncbi:MAG: dUTP diphosphatase [Chloracidobacterium sp.]|nr:dUTP diphosphatase [Chloracidobacterium sp.]